MPDAAALVPSAFSCCAASRACGSLPREPPERAGVSLEAQALSRRADDGPTGAVPPPPLPAEPASPRFVFAPSLGFELGEACERDPGWAARLVAEVLNGAPLEAVAPKLWVLGDPPRSDNQSARLGTWFSYPPPKEVVKYQLFATPPLAGATWGGYPNHQRGGGVRF